MPWTEVNTMDCSFLGANHVQYIILISTRSSKLE